MLEKVSDLIVDVARREDLILRRFGKGVLLIPELAFAYLVGRELASNADKIFGTSNVIWKPGKKIAEKSGITDLVFEPGKKPGIAIEFKISGKKDSYKADIEKLKNIPGNYEKIFCALIDAWPNTVKELEKDPRVVEVESQNGVSRLCRDAFFDFFTTLNDNYQGQICCIVGVWKIS